MLRISIKHSIFILLCYVVSFAVSAKDIALPQTMTQLLQMKYGITRIGSHAFGELDSSGNKYLVLLSQQEPPNKEGLFPDWDVTVVVFELKAGDLRKIAESKTWFCSENRSHTAVAIRNKSFFISTTGTGGAYVNAYDQYQFRKRHNHFELIGVERGETDLVAQRYLIKGKSINYPSRRFITWYENSSKPIALHSIGRWLNGHREQERPFTTTKIWQLSEFNPKEYDIWEERVLASDSLQ